MKMMEGDDDEYLSVNLSAESKDDSPNPLVHPNEESPSKSKREKNKLKGIGKYLHRFDELILKPIFIYKYERNMQKKSEQFFELFQK